MEQDGSMIKGTGIDIVKISRISSMVEKYGDTFTQKVFTPSEVKYCLKKANPGLHFAGRWAVKEAFYKALPADCQKVSFWKSIEILSSKGGKPEVHVITSELKGALDVAGITDVFVSISHEKEFAVASITLQ